MKKLLFSICLLAITLFAVAQDSTAVQAEREGTGLRAEGKIYVVMLVSVTILVGLFIYLIRLDRKISKIERQSAERRQQ
ncbi:MAG: hypothetical protein JNK79_09540 [Chitinophagaceae bacterium]|nr:hypothetical protein [Chitinophagaceae bacterium]